MVNWSSAKSSSLKFYWQNFGWHQLESSMEQDTCEQLLVKLSRVKGWSQILTLPVAATEVSWKWLPPRSIYFQSILYLIPYSYAPNSGLWYSYNVDSFNTTNIDFWSNVAWSSTSACYLCSYSYFMYATLNATCLIKDADENSENSKGCDPQKYNHENAKFVSSLKFTLKICT